MDLVKEIETQISTLENTAETLMRIGSFMRTVFLDGRLPEEPTEEQPQKVTLEEVRSVLTELSRAGYTESVRQLILRHGASSLSGLDPAEYAAVLREAEAITDAA